MEPTNQPPVGSVDHESLHLAQDKPATLSTETAVPSGPGLKPPQDIAVHVMETPEPPNDSAVHPGQEAVVAGQNPKAEQSPKPPGQVSEPQEQVTLHPDQKTAAGTSAPANENIVPSPQDTNQSKEQTGLSKQDQGPDPGLNPGPESPKTTPVAPVQPPDQIVETSDRPQETMGSPQPTQKAPAETKKPTLMSNVKSKIPGLRQLIQSQSKSTSPQGQGGPGKAPPKETRGTTPIETRGQISEGETQKAGVEDSKKELYVFRQIVPPPNSTSTPAPNNSPAPPSTSASPPNNPPAPPLNSTSASPPNDSSTLPLNNPPAPPLNSTSTPPLDITSASPPNDSSTPLLDITSASPPNDSSTPPPNSTSASTPNDSSTLPPNRSSAPPPNDPSVPCVNIIAVYDIGERIEGSWVYTPSKHSNKKRPKSGLKSPRPSTSSPDNRRPPSPIPPSQTADIIGATEGLRVDQADTQPRPAANNRSRSRSRSPGGLSSEISSVDWLRSESMLRKRIPNARVFAYSYPKPDNNKTPGEYLGDVADKLKLHITMQLSEQSNRGPIVFVGHGFGCIVLLKAIALLTEEDLKLTAGTILLDAPQQPLRKDTDKDSSSYSQSQNAKSGWLGWLRFWHTTPGGTITAIDILNSFDKRAKEYKVPVMWFYAYKSEPPDFLERFGIKFRESGKTKGLVKFTNHKDEDYRELMHEMQRCLMIKVSASKSLKNLLTEFVKPSPHRFRPGVRDHLRRGQSPLHIAASIENFEAIDILTLYGSGLVTMQDDDEMTPLHIGVRKAAKFKADDSQETPEPRTDKEELAEMKRRKAWKKRIPNLMKVEREQTVNQMDIKDKDKRVPLDYAKNHEWIVTLLNKRFLMKGVTETGPKDFKPVGIPKEKQQMVCISWEAVVIELFWTKMAKEKLDIKWLDIHSLIYAQQGEENYISLSGSVAKGPKCRWIHIPANNEQWVHDLFVKLGIRDDSMSGRRYLGSKLYDRYMISQARKYEHFRKQHNKGRDDQNLNIGTGGSNIVKPPIRKSDIISAQDGRGPIFSVTDVVGNTGRLQIEEQAASSIPLDLDNPATLGWEKSEAIVIFIPILGFEKHRHRKYLTRAIAELPPEKEPPEEEINDVSLLVKGYLRDQKEKLKPLHCRRTLDQFFHQMNSTEERDRAQIVYRWAKREKQEVLDLPKDRPVLMVDQLWLWVLHDGNVITSFPDTWQENETFNLKKRIIEYITGSRNRSPIKTTDDLAHLILRKSLNFLDRKGPMDAEFQKCFQSTINDISVRRAKLFESYNETKTTLFDHSFDTEFTPTVVEELFLLPQETLLLTEIMNIQDQLNIVQEVLAQQKKVLVQLFHLYPGREDQGRQLKILDYGGGEPQLGETERFREFKEKQESSPNAKKGLLTNDHLAQDNISLVNDNIRIVQRIFDSAENVKKEVNNLIYLKQKLANAWESRVTRKVSNAGQRQSNIILVFTIVTIVFLPLSFISSFLALSIDRFPKDANGDTLWPLNRLAGYLFGISAAISIPLIIVAFSVNPIKSWAKSELKDVKNDWKGKKEKWVKAHPNKKPKKPKKPKPPPKTKDLEKDQAMEKYSDSDKEGSVLEDKKPEPTQPLPDPSKDVSVTPLFGTFTFLTKISGLRKLWPFKKDTTGPNHPNGPNGDPNDHESLEDENYVPTMPNWRRRTDSGDSDSDIYVSRRSPWRRRDHSSRASSSLPRSRRLFPLRALFAVVGLPFPWGSSSTPPRPRSSRTSSLSSAPSRRRRRRRSSSTASWASGSIVEIRRRRGTDTDSSPESVKVESDSSVSPSYDDSSSASGRESSSGQRRRRLPRTAAVGTVLDALRRRRRRGSLDLERGSVESIDA